MVAMNMTSTKYNIKNLLEILSLNFLVSRISLFYRKNLCSFGGMQIRYLLANLQYTHTIRTLWHKQNIQEIEPVYQLGNQLEPKYSAYNLSKKYKEWIAS